MKKKILLMALFVCFGTQAYATPLRVSPIPPDGEAVVDAKKLEVMEPGSRVASLVTATLELARPDALRLVVHVIPSGLGHAKRNLFIWTNTNFFFLSKSAEIVSLASLQKAATDDPVIEIVLREKGQELKIDVNLKSETADLVDSL